MRKKVLSVASEIAQIISRWDGIEVILLGEAADIEIYDPYFSIDIEVFYRGSIPPRNDRRDYLLNVRDSGGFECSPVYPVDKFLIGELPVKVHYQETVRTELILERIERGKWIYRENGTTEFYIIVNSKVLFKASDWLDRMRERTLNVPESFWKQIVEVTRCGMINYLNDIGAAAYRGDNLFFLTATSNFVRSLICFLFAQNKEFLPGGRMIFSKLDKLKKLPEGFRGRFENLLRVDASLDMEKKREIAELLVRSIIDWS